MPDWEELEFKKKTLKRKDVYNEFGRKVPFQPLEKIPRLRKGSECKSDYECERETPVWKEDEDLSNQTDEFLTIAKAKGFADDQALNVLMYNEFCTELALCDLDIYKPLLGLRSENLDKVLQVIVGSVRHAIGSRRDRDLNDVLTQFPCHTIGEVLDFYASNRLSVKRCTVLDKRRVFKRARRGFGSFMEHVDLRKCGPILRQRFRDRKKSDMAAGVGLGSRRRPCSLEHVRAMLESETPHREDVLDAGMRGRKFVECREAYEALFEDIRPADIELEITRGREARPDLRCIDHSVEQDLARRTNLGVDTVLNRLEAVEKWLLPPPPEQESPSTLRHRWSRMDIAIFLLALAKFGPDFEMVSAALATKSPAMTRSFYLTFRDRWRLDTLCPTLPDHPHVLAVL